MGKKNEHTYSILYAKINSGGLIDLNIKAKFIKLLEKFIIK